MASRKTYFGIGWPKDPADPAPTLGDADDRKDDGPSGEHSAPTVVDDEKVAEGLAQLRSWYQSDTADASRPAATSTPAAPSPDLPGARPTTVGHASSHQQAMPARPLAPDPMRATMFGHDIHRFDFDAPAAAPDLPPVTSAPQAAERAAAPGPSASAGASAGANAADSPPRRPEPTPQAPEWDAGGALPDAFRIADYLRRQAAQPHQAAARWVASRDTVPVRTNRGLPLLVFAIGFVALAVAVLLSVLSRDNSSSGSRPAPAPAPALTGSALDRPPAPLVPAEAPARAVTPARPVEKLGTTPTGGERPAVKRVESSAPNLLAKPKRRPAPVKSETESRDEESESPPSEARQTDESASTAPAAPAEVERPAPRARPTEPARPRKREKSIPLVDADSTLPPSTDD